MKFLRVRPEPTSPHEVIRPVCCNQLPEPGAVTEDPQMRQLVNDDRLESGRRSADQAPRERQRAIPGSAAPARARISQADSLRPDPHFGPMELDRPVDRLGRTLAQPGLKHGCRRPAVSRREPHDKLVLILRPAPLDRGAPGGRVGAHDPEPVDLAEIAKLGEVGDAASPNQYGPLSLQPNEVAADPWLSLGKEALHLPFRVGPTAARRRRDRDHDAMARIDGDPNPS